MRYNDKESGSDKPYSGDPEVDAVTARVRMAIAESNYRRTKASDTSRMNKVFKPKASPGPAKNTLNLYGAPKNPPASARTLNLYGAPKPKKVNANTRENRTSGPKSNAANVREDRVPTKSKTGSKAGKTVAGFKKGSIGERAISSFKNAYRP